MVRRSAKRWWPVLLVALALPLGAAAAALTVSGGTLGSGAGNPATCDTGSPAVVQNVGTGSTNIVSVDVSGIAAACGGGTVKVALFNNVDAVQEATAAIPAGGGTVNVSFTPVALKDSHLLSVTLQGP